MLVSSARVAMKHGHGRRWGWLVAGAVFLAGFPETYGRSVDRGVFASDGPRATLTLSPAAGRRGDTVSLSSILADQNTAARTLTDDIEFDPQSFSLLSCTINTAVGVGSEADKQLLYRTLRSGLVRVLLFGLNQNSLPQGPLYDCEFEVLNGARGGRHSIVHHSIVADRLASDVEVIDAPGEIAVIPCIGDCSEDFNVSIEELILGVRIALGSATVEQCLAFDEDSNSRVQVNELVYAVRNAFNTCRGAS